MNSKESLVIPNVERWFVIMVDKKNHIPENLVGFKNLRGL